MSLIKVQVVMKANPRHGMKIIAKEFALLMHGSQQYGDSPYEYHLQAVVDVLKRFGFDDSTLIAAAWLHDVLEDTEATSEDLKARFTADVVDTVERVSTEPGKNRKERTERTYPKIRGSQNAVILKLADRIANVEACLKDNPGLLEMYSREYEAFRSALKRPDDPEELWSHLDALLV